MTEMFLPLLLQNSQTSTMAHTRLLAALLLLLGCALPPAQGSPCPESYFMMGSRCVFVAQAGEPGFGYSNYVTWNSARKRCAKMVNGNGWTADLVSNYDAAFQRLLTKHIKANPDGKYYDFYHVGGEFVNGEWRWLDGTPIDVMDYIWYILSPPADLTGSVYQYMTTGVSFLRPSERLVLSPNRPYVRSPHYVCEAKPAAA